MTVRTRPKRTTRWSPTPAGPGESLDESGDVSLADDIVEDSAAEVYVLDGFSVCLRGHASVTGLAGAIRERRARAPVVAGMLLAKEIEFIVEGLGDGVRRPYIAVVGGAKVAGKGGKLAVVRGLAERADGVLFGGAMLAAMAGEPLPGVEVLDTRRLGR